jgi:hypothetical protein
MLLAVGHASGAVVVWDLQRRPARLVATIGVCLCVWVCVCVCLS